MEWKTIHGLRGDEYQFAVCGTWFAVVRRSIGGGWTSFVSPRAAPFDDFDPLTRERHHASDHNDEDAARIAAATKAEFYRQPRAQPSRSKSQRRATR